MESVLDDRTPISILIAVAFRIYREGLAEILKAKDQLRVLGTAATFLETQSAARALQPDVVIVDVSIPDALDLIRALRAELARSRILAFGVREDIAAILGFADAGADGFVTPNGSSAELISAIERTAAGELLCSPRIAAQLLRRASHQYHHSREPAAHPLLTAREDQVYSLLRQGGSNKEIAAALNISEATVKNHVHHLLGKLRVATRGQAVAMSASPSQDAAP